jgi:hypothetical protein
VHGKLKPTNA